MKEIKLTRGYVALVDDEDYERINSFRWCAHFNPTESHVYAMRRNNFKKAIWMHHQVLIIKSLEPGMEVDHIDRNSLNNQKSNLRIVSHAVNIRNSLRTLNATNIVYDKRRKLWYARLPRPKRTFLGYVKTREEAIELARQVNHGCRNTKDRELD